MCFSHHINALAMVRPSSKLFTSTSNLLFIYFFSFFTSTNDDIGGGQNIHIYFLLLLLLLTTRYFVYTQYLFYRTAVLYSILCTMFEGWGKYIWNETPVFFSITDDSLFFFLSLCYMLYNMNTKNIICGQRPENIFLSINIEHVHRYYVQKNMWSFWQSPQTNFPFLSVILHALRLCVSLFTKIIKINKIKSLAKNKFIIQWDKIE